LFFLLQSFGGLASQDIQQLTNCVLGVTHGSKLANGITLAPLPLDDGALPRHN